MTPLTSSMTSHKKLKMQNKVSGHISSEWKQHLMRRSSDYVIYVAKWAISVFPHTLGMKWGYMTDLTSDNLHEKSEICKMWVPEGLLPFEGFIILVKITCHWQRCQIVSFCDVGMCTYDVIGQWLDLTCKCKKFIMPGLNRVSHPKFILSINFIEFNPLPIGLDL